MANPLPPFSPIADPIGGPAVPDPGISSPLLTVGTIGAGTGTFGTGVTSTGTIGFISGSGLGIGQGTGIGTIQTAPNNIGPGTSMVGTGIGNIGDSLGQIGTVTGDIGSPSALAAIGTDNLNPSGSGLSSGIGGAGSTGTAIDLSVASLPATPTPVPVVTSNDLTGVYSGRLRLKGPAGRSKQVFVLDVQSQAATQTAGTFSLTGTLAGPQLGNATFVGFFDGTTLTLTFSGDVTGSASAQVVGGGRLSLAGALSTSDGSTGSFRVKNSSPAPSAGSNALLAASYSGTLKLARQSTGVAETGNAARERTFALSILSQAADGTVTATVTIEGEGTFAVSGMVSRRRATLAQRKHQGIAGGSIRLTRHYRQVLRHSRITKDSTASPKPGLGKPRERAAFSQRIRFGKDRSTHFQPAISAKTRTESPC
jgi:hypothetical protein